MTPDDLEPLSETTKALLDAERPLDAVPAATRAKLFAKMSVTMAAGATAGAAGSAAATGGKVAKVAAVSGKAALASKVVIAAVAFSVGGGVGAGVHAVAAKRQLAPAPAPIVIRMGAAPVPPPPPPPVVVDAPPAPPPVKAPAAPKRDTLGAERSLVEQARAALARHEAAAALDALEQHEREYPAGQLTEERMALQVVALADSGATEQAHAVAAKFRTRYRESLLMPAVDAASPP